jgi:hypothetical protein
MPALDGDWSLNLATAGTAFGFIGIIVFAAGLGAAITSVYRARRPTSGTAHAIRFATFGFALFVAAFALMILGIPPSVMAWPLTGLIALPISLLGIGIGLWAARARIGEDDTTGK